MGVTRIRRARLRSHGAMVLVAAIALITLIVATNDAGALPAPDSADLLINADVDASVAVAPTVTRGDVDVELDDIGIPGEYSDGTSSGWSISSAWPLGYDITMSSTTSPALRGANATDGAGARGSFENLKTSGCPCTWGTGMEDTTKGRFGYTVDGTLPGVAATWESGSSNLWRGLTTTPYDVASTGGIGGPWTFSMTFRAQVPDDGAQVAGSYRATAIVGVEPTI